MKNIAVLTSGGDAPGMNAAIRAVVRTAVFHNRKIFGVKRGYEGMIDGEIEEIATQDVGNILHRGGTFLKTARSARFMTVEGRERAFHQLKNKEIDGCIVIGGNGTFTGALEFSKEFDLPFIGIPGTIDNDLYGTDYTIGFDTAINTAVDACDRIRDTADSHDRLFFVEVMGRQSGFIALNTGIASGAGSILIPEVAHDINDLIKVLNYGARRQKKFSLIVVAEGNPFGGAQAVADMIKKQYEAYDTKVTIIGHLQRGGAPSCFDRVLASRLGYSAVNFLIQGEKNKMVGMVANNICLTNFDDAIFKQKEMDKDLLKMAEILAL